MSARWTEQDWIDYQSRRGGLPALPAEPKPSKYRNKRTEVDGIVFDSKREASRYRDLVIRERFGLISDLRRQITYPLVVNEVHIASYRSDFEYVEDGKKITEDAKGVRTREYRIKKKLMRALYGIEIRET